MTRGWSIPVGQLPDVGPGMDRSGYYIGIGRAEMGRRQIFGIQSGVAVTMTERVFDIPAFAGACSGTNISLQPYYSMIYVESFSILRGREPSKAH
jgi:hypothetical protein